jgi:hypothetical protein
MVAATEPGAVSEPAVSLESSMEDESYDDTEISRDDLDRPQLETAENESEVSLSAAAISEDVETVEGAVIVPPGIFGKQIMYLNGLQLYQYYGDFPTLAVGT